MAAVTGQAQPAAVALSEQAVMNMLSQTMTSQDNRAIFRAFYTLNVGNILRLQADLAAWEDGTKALDNDLDDSLYRYSKNPSLRSEHGSFLGVMIASLPDRALASYSKLCSFSESPKSNLRRVLSAARGELPQNPDAWAFLSKAEKGEGQEAGDLVYLYSDPYGNSAYSLVEITVRFFIKV